MEKNIMHASAMMRGSKNYEKPQAEIIQAGAGKPFCVSDNNGNAGDVDFGDGGDPTKSPVGSSNVWGD